LRVINVFCSSHGDIFIAFYDYGAFVFCKLNLSCFVDDLKYFLVVFTLLHLVTTIFWLDHFNIDG